MPAPSLKAIKLILLIWKKHAVKFNFSFRSQLFILHLTSESLKDASVFVLFVFYPNSSISSSLHSTVKWVFLCYGESSWQFVTKCCKFINETTGNIKSQLKEAIKSKILIGLVPPLNLFSVSLFFREQ